MVCKYQNVGIFQGAMRSGDGSGQSVIIKGSTPVIKNNRISKSGSNGISFYGSNALIEKTLLILLVLPKMTVLVFIHMSGPRGQLRTPM